jgi:hypothetical protein
MNSSNSCSVLTELDQGAVGGVAVGLKWWQYGTGIGYACSMCGMASAAVWFGAFAAAAVVALLQA